uniref:Uncharacterized protein n=1 Tax=Brassica oleracea var. oleracea TaxID=109376 RepID=A0A0D3C1T3_BRAOL
METSSLKVEISAQVTSQGLSLGLLNSVLISQCREIEEFLVDESDDGNITSLGSYPDSSVRAQLINYRFSGSKTSNQPQFISKSRPASTTRSCPDLSPIRLFSNHNGKTCRKGPC